MQTFYDLSIRPHPPRQSYLSDTVVISSRKVQAVHAMSIVSACVCVCVCVCKIIKVKSCGRKNFFWEESCLDNKDKVNVWE